MFVTDFNGFGFSWLTITFMIAGMIIFPLLFRFLSPKLFNFFGKACSVGLPIMAVVFLLVAQSIHAFAYAHNMSAVLQYTPSIPWYTPLTANRQLKKWQLIFEDLKEEQLTIAGGQQGQFIYPLSPLQCDANATPNIIVIALESWRFDAMNADITPNIWSIAQQGLNFEQHLSGSNVTTNGLFSLFYGLSPVYWPDAMAAKAQPSLLQHLKQQQYQFYLLANQDIERTGIKDVIFPGIKAISSQSLGNSVQGDQAITELLLEQLQFDDEQEEMAPFFAFMLYNSTHHSYYRRSCCGLIFVTN